MMYNVHCTVSGFMLFTAWRAEKQNSENSCYEFCLSIFFKRSYVVTLVESDPEVGCIFELHKRSYQRTEYMYTMENSFCMITPFFGLDSRYLKLSIDKTSGPNICKMKLEQ